MYEIKLKENWKMKCEKEEEWLDTTVPGSVYATLLARGKMEDPYYRANENQALPLMNQDFLWRTVFDAPEEIWEQENTELVFDGIDTIADIYLNGVFLGHVQNMHRTWVYEVKRYLRRKENELQVVLRSPTQFIENAWQKKPIDGAKEAMRGFPYLRKAHCMFGWDWGPRLPDAGIWKDVTLRGYHKARLDSVYITQLHEAGAVTLGLDADIFLPDGRLQRFEVQNPQGFQLRVLVTDPDEKRVFESENAAEAVIENPKLWWPNGYGEQPLYEVEVQLLCNGEVLDSWKRRIGLRTMTVSRQKDVYGEEFAHVVNGVKIFAMGADYIPEDCILPRVTPERTRRLLEQAKAAHFNCIRVWGGGYYPKDDFWDSCDELGLVVWEDCMFACALYELTEEFEEEVRREIIDNVKRIRHHASLGLWCGNNEMEMFLVEDRFASHSLYLKADYVKMYEYLIPKLMKQYDPNTFYWPASPSSGGCFDDPNDEGRGDVHYWDVWHANKPFTEYRKFHFRYLSEFGFQSFPSLKTCESFTKPEDRNIFSYVMEKHQRNYAANGKIMNYMEQTFLYPSDFGTLLYASQLLQAEAIRYGVEHFRRFRGRCMGTIVWQLDDNWPVASWSSIDYYGRWKALHYYEKRFFAPLMISCEENGTLSQDPDPNAQPYDLKKSFRLCVCNETRFAQKATVSWELRNTDSSVVRAQSLEIEAEPLSSLWLSEVDMQEADPTSQYLSYALTREGKTLSSGTVLFIAPKFFRFQDPKLKVSADQNEIVVSAGCYAKSVEIQNEEENLLLEDNYFDMNAGTRRIRILGGKPVGLRVRSVYDIR